MVGTPPGCALGGDHCGCFDPGRNRAEIHACGCRRVLGSIPICTTARDSRRARILNLTGAKSSACFAHRVQNFPSRHISSPHSFIHVTPILRILFVLAMLEVPASAVGTLNNRPFCMSPTQVIDCGLQHRDCRSKAACQGHVGGCRRCFGQV